MKKGLNVNINFSNRFFMLFAIEFTAGPKTAITKSTTVDGFRRVVMTRDISILAIETR